MTGAIASDLQIIHSYRHLYRQALRAVQFSKPARFGVRDRIRAAYRRNAKDQYNESRIQNTLTFLRGATETRGIEHRILKNLLYTRFWEARRKLRGYRDARIRSAEEIPNDINHQHFNATLAMLNESMGLCLY